MCELTAIITLLFVSPSRIQTNILHQSSSSINSLWTDFDVNLSLFQMIFYVVNLCFICMYKKSFGSPQLPKATYISANVSEIGHFFWDIVLLEAEFVLVHGQSSCSKHQELETEFCLRVQKNSSRLILLVFTKLAVTCSFHLWLFQKQSISCDICDQVSCTIAVAVANGWVSDQNGHCSNFQRQLMRQNVWAIDSV